MKGNPLLRIAIILLILTAVFWPVFKITKHSETASPHIVPEAKPSPSPGAITSSLRATLLVHTAPVPLHCSISQHGVVLLSESNVISPGEYRASIEIAKGEDLVITADWNDEDPHAIRTEVLIHGYQIPLEKSFWAQRSLEDTLPIPESFLP